MALTCRQCGFENAAGAVFCESCQATLGTTMTYYEAPPEPDSDLEDRIRTALADQVRILRELGRGGMAIVFEGLDLQLNRKVAVKCLPNTTTIDRELIQRFQMEAKLAAGLNHPHIVPIFTVGVADKVHYFTMSYMQGGSLEDRIRRGMSLEESVEIICQIASALDYAHTKNLVHRDVKPSNVMFDEHGTVRVLDFGIARLLSGARMTVTRAVLGTPDYMSPEQALSRPIDGRSDLYSLGVIFYKMLTSQLPFTADEPLAVIYKHVHEKPTPPHRVVAEVPPVLSRVVLRLMSKEPENRYASGAELIEDLRSPEVQVSLHPRHQRRTASHSSKLLLGLQKRWRRADTGQRLLLALLPVLVLLAVLLWPVPPKPLEPAAEPLLQDPATQAAPDPKEVDPPAQQLETPAAKPIERESASEPVVPKPQPKPRREQVVAERVEAPAPQVPTVDPLIERIRAFGFVDILPEPFKMGQSRGEPDERPPHTVALSPYGLSRTEVTQELWELVMGENPSCNRGPSLPVENVSYEQVSSFIERLNARTNGVYRLPTEAEWEYACSKGRRGPYGPIALDDLCWYSRNAPGTQPVGSKRANGLGLSDMQGNVWEWCLDRYDPDYYKTSPERDPRGPASGNEYVLRGGSFNSVVRECQSQSRHKQLANFKDCATGFRLAYGH